MIITNNNIHSIIENKKDYYCKLIRGALEIEIINYLNNLGFFFLPLSLLKKMTGTKSHVISFEYDEQKLELNSSQALQITALSALYGKVFSINESFRKEISDDTHHLSEFKMLELEMPINNEIDIFEFIENLLRHIVDWYNNYLRENELLDLFSEKKLELPIEHITYDDMILTYKHRLQNLTFDHFSFCDDEVTKVCTKPLFVQYYPYIGSWRALRKDKDHSYLYNLILPHGFGELIEFSIRETNYNFYRKKFEIVDCVETYDWYLEAIKSNQCKRAGLGMGIERLGAWLMNLEVIESQLIFPNIPERDKNN